VWVKIFVHALMAGKGQTVPRIPVHLLAKMVDHAMLPMHAAVLTVGRVQLALHSHARHHARMAGFALARIPAHALHNGVVLPALYRDAQMNARMAETALPPTNVHVRLGGPGPYALPLSVHNSVCMETVRELISAIVFPIGTDTIVTLLGATR
jgi:hypothetical protein